MLKSILIKNFILLDNVKIDFTKGFNVLCGETGAGKSIIIKALDCVLGAKITKEMLFNKDIPCVIEAESNEATFDNFA
ncbi:AAA family ATPase [bacterium]|nr:AAA family ATPase [bacterium]